MTPKQTIRKGTGAVASALAVAALAVPAALAGHQDLGPQAALKLTNHVGPAAPVAQAGSLDPWFYGVILRSKAASAPLRGEHSFGQNSSAAQVRLDPGVSNPVRLVTEHTRGQYRPLPSAVSAPAPAPFVESGGFRWGDAGIGAGIAAGLMLIAASAAVGFRRTQGRQASA